jgi:integrase
MGGPPKESSLNIELVYAKAMLNFAVERGMIKRNPLLLAKHVSVMSQRETRLTPDDIEKLLAAADDVINRRIREGDDDGSWSRLLKAFILCIFDSMMRFNEARLLRVGRIGADGTYELLASETKSKKRRFVKLSARTMEAIAAIQRPPRATYVFEDRDGLVTENRMRDYFRRACELSGVDARATERDKQVRPHDARAGGATTADENGARARAIQRTLGHASLRMTERYLRSDDQENARHVGEIMERATRIGPKRVASRNKVKKSVDG